MWVASSLVVKMVWYGTPQMDTPLRIVRRVTAEVYDPV